MKRIHGISYLMVACLMILSSCEKDPKSSGDYDSSMAQDQSFAENTLEEVSKIADQACDEMTLRTYRTGNDNSNSATITSTVSGNTKTVTIDFGAVDVTCMDGKRRKGKIMVSFTGNYRDVNGTHTITFENYFVNDYKVNGSKVVTNSGKNALNQTVFTIETHVTLGNTSGQTMAWNSNRMRTWIEGESTTYASDALAGVRDDVYEVTGTASGTSFNGLAFTVTITEPVRIETDCRFITKGKAELMPEGKALRIINYGDGTCDGYIIVTINGIEYTVNFL